MRIPGARPTGLRKHELAQLMRISRQNKEKADKHHDRVKYLTELRQQRNIMTLKIERDNLLGARVNGALSAAAERRLSDLKTMIPQS